MTIATPERYAQMLDAARRGGYAYPAINVTSTQTLNAALQGFAEAESDGIIQVSVGGAAYLSGQRVNDRVTGSLAFAAFAHEVAAKYPNITIALHTDHCAKQYLDEWVRPLLDHEAEQVKHGQEPTFQSHMWDGSTVPLGENLDIAEELQLLIDNRGLRGIPDDVFLLFADQIWKEIELDKLWQVARFGEFTGLDGLHIAAYEALMAIAQPPLKATRASR